MHKLVIPDGGLDELGVLAAVLVGDHVEVLSPVLRRERR